MRYLKLFFTLTALLVLGPAMATHNRAGEITYEWITGFTYRVTITTYTKESAPADRCELDINWGDNTSSTLVRVNGPAGCSNGGGLGESLGNDFKKNIYIGTHTYPAAGIYTMSVLDPNRNGGVSNIPGSINVPFYIESVLRINPQLGNNNSVTLLNPPIDDGCTQQLFLHNPSAYDADGDSLVFDLVDCRGLNGTPIPETYDPAYVQDSIKIDPVTGELIWDVPQNAGQFNFAIRITEYRLSPLGAWEFMGSVVRDMQVDIQACTNQPPVIDPLGPFCVIAGQNLFFNVSASDPNGDPIVLTATGGPFQLSPPPSFPQPVSGLGAVSAPFSWNTACSHVRRQPYFVDFKVKENFPATNPTPELAAFRTAEIRVIAPPVDNLQAVGAIGQINLSWDPHICPQATEHLIYRRKGPSGYTPGACETGLPASAGFDLIATVPAAALSYEDSVGLEQGNSYCYRIVTLLQDGSESIVSLEACTELFRTAPVITKVDVDTTAPATGRINLEWATPKEIDSASFPPPYGYALYRAPVSTGVYQLVQNFGFIDTVFQDSGLNTETESYRYRVDFLAGSPALTVAESAPASSFFLRPLGVDEGVLLTLDYQVPWEVEAIAIFRENPIGSGNFDSIAQVSADTYLDTGLVNGETYCYYIKTKGAYTGTGLWSPLVNRSQIACATATDTSSPCAPVLAALAECEDNTLKLSWVNPTDSGCGQDIRSYNLYFKPFEEAPWELLASGIIPTNFDQFTGPIVGCYAVTAVDDAGGDPGGTPNESPMSNVICIPPCPLIQLPNVFTPNGSGVNDRFWPVRDAGGNPLVRDIDLLTITVYNRWGTLVYKSTNRDEFVQTGWDGKDQSSGADCSEGVYFYHCVYTVLGVETPVEHELKGIVHLFR